jgi:hypothetical protein
LNIRELGNTWHRGNQEHVRMRGGKAREDT